MCVFCRIIAGEVPASKVYEDEQSFAFLDIQPITPGHILVIPKTHTKSLLELSKAEAVHLVVVGQKMDQALRESGLKCEGVNLFLADGRAAGQEVDHVHLHVFPRFEGDGFGFCFGSGYRKQPGREELDRNAEKIRQALSD
jgi:histidine triad (HIT) family protein